jgi:DNA gyrase subunit A
MITIKRPDLSRVDPAIREYIEALEAEIQRFSRHVPKESPKPVQSVETEELPPVSEVLEPSEPPTTLNVVTASLRGVIKRTPRHLYLRQRRGGMGIFDLETHSEDNPAFLAIADEAQSLLIFTNYARVYRLPVNKLPESPVRSRGQALDERLLLEPDERPAAILPDQASGYVALVSQSGVVRCLRHHLFGEYMKPGTALFNIKESGPLAAACWTPGDAELLITTQNGLAIRFGEKLIPPRGALGIRLSAGDAVVGVTSVDDSSRVFILSSEGKGTLRLMSGFAPNKAPGGSGKVVMKAERIVAAFSVEPVDDIFVISHLGKIIRLKSEEVASSEGAIQGVYCINLRGDETTGAVRSIPVKPR